MIRATLTATVVAVAVASSPAEAKPACHEDQACWVWSTMGNRSRGIATVDGARHVIVGPCRFARLYRFIDWGHTPHLRGDATARNMGCAAYRPVAPESIY